MVQVCSSFFVFFKNKSYFSSGTPNDCLVDKWRPWNSTWCGSTNDSAFHDNNVRNGDDRMQILNPV